MDPTLTHCFQIIRVTGGRDGANGWPIMTIEMELRCLLGFPRNQGLSQIKRSQTLILYTEPYFRRAAGALGFAVANILRWTILWANFLCQVGTTIPHAHHDERELSGGFVVHYRRHARHSQAQERAS